ncbi:hypothetical protein AVEN_73896-1 [Araneus ventricosus]|uniref:RNase H type-1 domain-containing protein n=1 Tax=Araneus ventricosus TaxID=182803 RepID=A0A4Y2QW49_ARAVE|nr:hypothetical protein AVEN_73896-1 [Araneus ventricosus]
MARNSRTELGVPLFTSIKKMRFSQMRRDVFMAEVVAIRQAVNYIIGRQLRRAKIISDSRSALMSLASVHERRVIITEIKDIIREYLGDIQLIWIRAHRGFEGNERADQLAKMASTKDHVDFFFFLSF